LKEKALKFWWSDEANVYKHKAIEHRHICNKPESGILFDNMKDCKYKYKLFLKNQKAKACNKISDSLTDCLENKNKTQFLKTWKAKFGNSKNNFPYSIDDCDNH